MTITVAQRARYFREQLGLTQEQAAERAGMSQASWSRLESGAKKPTVGDVLGMSWALGVPFDTMRGTGEIRSRLLFAARTVDETPIDQAEELDFAKEELMYLMEFAAELEEAGFLPVNG